MAKTVDFGIDLGTTNSAVARMTARGAEIIPVKRLNYIPSAVAVDKRGDLKVGTEALNPLLEYARWFKRLMGTTNVAQIAGQSWSPQMMSAEVLKALKAAAKLKTGDDIVDVVITVPAMFTQPQCAATHEAAQLAGLNAVSLLQEPIAAATAYLSEDPKEGHYLVYDLGGGTFDVSLIRLYNGEMNVVEHGGDNYLGGADFDRTIFDWALDQIDRNGGETLQFQSESAARRQLLQACEEARIALSDDTSATIYLDDFDLPISKIELSRERLEDLLEALVTRTIEIARDRVTRASLHTNDIRSVLLVGGPTQMPYVRARLENELKIPLNLEQDPMTVVARGAAIHASTIIRRSDSAAAQPTTEKAVLELFYEPVSPEEYAFVAGKVIQPADFKGEVKIKSSRGDWETGWTTLLNGAFNVEVTLARQAVSEFQIELRDLQGNPCSCHPNSFVIRSGVRAAQPVTPYNYGVVLEGGRKVGQIVTAGEVLPASGFSDFRLARTLVAGSPDELKIYFVEGQSSLAEENINVGDITIRGTDIRRTVKENERIEIRIRMDESRRLKATVHIPLLDEDFAIDLNSTSESPNTEDLAAAVIETRLAINDFEDHVEESEQELVLRASRQIEQLEALLERVANGEAGEAERIHKQLSDTKASIRPLRDKYGLRAKHADILEVCDQTQLLCRHFNDQLGLARLDDYRTDADKALRLEQEKTLATIYDRVCDLFWEHYGKTEECWEHQVKLMRERAPLASDSVTYHELIRRAERALHEGDFEGVRLVAIRAYDYLPDEEKMRNRFHDAALR